WKQGPYAAESSRALYQQCTRLLQGKSQRVRDDGDFDDARAIGAHVVDATWSTAARVVDAYYRLPFLAHATMEPQNACPHVQADRVTIVSPMQSPVGALSRVSAITG